MEAVGSAATGLQLVSKTGAFIMKVRQAEESAKHFLSLRNAVNRDFEYAKVLWKDLSRTIVKFPSQDEWIISVLRAAGEAIAAFDKPLSHAPGSSGNSTLGSKSKYVLWYAEQTMEMQICLSVSHASLLQAINLMHQLAAQRGGPLVRKPSDPGQRASTIPRQAQDTQLDPALTDLSPNPTVSGRPRYAAFRDSCRTQPEVGATNGIDGLRHDVCRNSAAEPTEEGGPIRIVFYAEN